VELVWGGALLPNNKKGSGPAPVASQHPNLGQGDLSILVCPAVPEESLRPVGLAELQVGSGCRVTTLGENEVERECGIRGGRPRAGIGCNGRINRPETQRSGAIVVDRVGAHELQKSEGGLGARRRGQVTISIELNTAKQEKRRLGLRGASGPRAGACASSGSSARSSGGRVSRGSWSDQSPCESRGRNSGSLRYDHVWTDQIAGAAKASEGPNKSNQYIGLKHSWRRAGGGAGPGASPRASPSPRSRSAGNRHILQHAQVDLGTVTKNYSLEIRFGRVGPEGVVQCY
jgi:hypothetical protein